MQWWKKPDFDPYFFDPEKSTRTYGFIYNSIEMRDIIIDYLDWLRSDYPVCKQAIDLLRATIQFRAETSPESYFAEQRKSAQATPEDFKAPLEKMASVIQAAQQQLSLLDRQSNDYQFLSSAIRYCLTSVNERMNKLKMNEDAIYQKYFPGSKLQKMLEEQDI
ncbi:hypothetical protein [Aquicella lusitana]|uniref:Uncharacterized protein n=1 Tax=Aquicella lusitana TaxID=254246 RepID=A0A370G8D8_9COXI|nr:hypothetical protein [Aquicella lusitana]RDI39199.1 hypothetical protein C8D86_1274 [Aquicella lusitana]VVC74058.1 hypothetical protein AQULUS_18210 [Aquicella lusitana]